MRKLVAVCLAVIFSLTLLLGCGSNKQVQAGQQATVSTQQQAAATKAQAKTETAQSSSKNNGQDSEANARANSGKLQISKDKTYTDKEHVAAYINAYNKLPSNFITKNEAKKLGWQTQGTLDKVAPGKSIGGDRYGNYEGKLPQKNGRSWKECDIDYVKGNRNGKRIVFSNDGLIYYTGDHYNTFTKLYGR